MMFIRKIRGYLLIITGFLACPCHLPLTLPLLLALTAGTAFGAFLSNKVWLIVAVSIAYFVGALALGIRYLGEGEKVCAMPEAQTKPPPASRAADHVSVREV